ncbi:MAG: ketoacyl-ACP synthase III [Bdellovibrionales bacterium]|nr:ketoacyl-ACP synthase III [Bdellovibrionales bacterium]
MRAPLFSKVVVHSFAREIPLRKVPNDDLAKLMDTNDDWIRKRTGIQTRYWVDEPTTTSNLGSASAKKTLALAGCDQVDAIIAATLSPDFNFPGIGVQIQNDLNLDCIPAYDIRNQCSGFLYALEMAGALIETGVYQRILVVGAEVHSTGLDRTTRGRDIAVLFGDGAGSCIVERKDCCHAPGPVFSLLGTELHSDGAFVDQLWCEHPGSAHFPIRVSVDLVEQGKIFPTMNGKLVFEHAVRRMVEVSMSLLGKLNRQPRDLRLIIPHQANLRINSLVAKQLGLDEEQVFNTIQKYGNTTAATIPIGFSHAVEECDLKPGDQILSAAFGSGFTWGAAVFEVVD